MEAQTLALLLRGSVKSTCPPQQQLSAKRMACTSHQDKLPSDVAQSAPHHQGRVQSVFQYDPRVDSVLRVTKEDYKNCYKVKPIEKYKEGMTKIELNHSGPFYFIGGSERK
uniref:Phytocyanin domain-containing protein n=1 Tax=Quercus lobata TaxID=97700 RepID=A0A7N2KXX9_QUELO